MFSPAARYTQGVSQAVLVGLTRLVWNFATDKVGVLEPV